MELTDSSSSESISSTSSQGSVESLELPETHTVRLIHINAQSLRYKLEELIAESVEADIISVTETWLSPEIASDNLKVPFFQPPIRKDRPGDPHGGVALYCREDLCMKHRPDLDVQELEALWVEIHVRQKNILIGTYYRPPNSKVETWTLIEQSIESAKLDKTNNIFIIGDLNCNMLIPNNRF